MTALATTPIVLASSSKTRRTLLEQAGLMVEIDPAGIDEEGLRESLSAENARPAQIAETLAELKTLQVSRRHGSTLVVGADQILACRGQIFAKPEARSGAATQLRALAGETHELATAVCVGRGGEIIWRHLAVAKLTMRRISESFIEAYLDAAGEQIYGNVGAYALEGHGIQLFSKIEGDFFSILGLPLLPLLAFLREHEVVPR